MIQTEIDNGRGGKEQLTPDDPRYWAGPYVYTPYPKTLFKASAGEGYLHPEQKVVQNAHEHEKLGSAWKESPDEARAYVDALDADVARAAAERQAADTKLSPKAQAEALADDRSTDEMLGAIAEKPKRKYVKKTVQ